MNSFNHFCYLYNSPFQHSFIIFLSSQNT